MTPHIRTRLADGLDNVRQQGNISFVRSRACARILAPGPLVGPRIVLPSFRLEILR